MMNIAVRSDDRCVTIDGLNIRYLEEGRGRADDPVAWRVARLFGRRVPPQPEGARAPTASAPSPSTCRASARATPTDDFSASYKKKIVLKFMDALKLDKAALDRASALRQTLPSASRSKIPIASCILMILGTGNLLPPLETGGAKVGGREGRSAGAPGRADGEAGAVARRYPRAARSQPVPPAS